eukprot:8882224-Alexandrium_andersonii.AAC.1
MPWQGTGSVARRPRAATPSGGPRASGLRMPRAPRNQRSRTSRAPENTSQTSVRSNQRMALRPNRLHEQHTATNTG